jgi:hypothetical protein
MSVGFGGAKLTVVAFEGRLVMDGTSGGFDSLPWHDACLQEVVIDRRSPGIRDEIRIRVSWPDGTAAEVVFSDCYAMTTELNFGVIADEQIVSGSISENDSALPALRAR